MRCFSCQAEARKGAKFCTQCGKRLSNVCPNCLDLLYEGDKFCSQCGVSLTEQTAPGPKLEDASPDLASHRMRTVQDSMPSELAAKIEKSKRSLEGERKNVTVLFADISGFTAMSELMDPEEVSTVMNNCFNVLTGCIYRYEGFIDKFIGDCIMALFGAPVAHENDPELAVRAALDMMRELEKFNRTLRVKLEKPLSLHIGINSGMVIAGSVGTDYKMDYTVMGDTVNLASRLESAAANGEIFVSQYTYNLARNLFDFEALTPMEIKGKREPVPVYKVLKLKSRRKTARELESFSAPMVGRTREFQQLMHCLEDLTNGEGQVITIQSDAGIGKSRFFAEFKARAREQGVTMVVGNCLSYGHSIAYSVFLDAMKAILGIEEEDLEENVRQRIMEGIPRLMGEEPQPLSDRARDIIPYIGKLFSVDFDGELGQKVRYLDPQQLMEMTFLALRKLLVGMALQRPLILALEDLHWADNTSLDLISYLMEAAAEVPLLLMCLYRPEKGRRCLHIGDMARAKCSDRYTEFDIEKLSPEEEVALIKALLEIDEVPPQILHTVQQKCAGNPFYIEEVLRTLIDQGAMKKVDGRWTITGDLEDIEIPDTVQGMIMSRIDRLVDSLKSVLQFASVVGRSFSTTILSRLIPENLDFLLDVLHDMDLIFESKAFPEREYSFKNAFTQEVTYNGLLLKRRKELHQKVADVIEELYHGRLEEYYEILAYHYSRAEAFLQASCYLFAAANKTKNMYANEVAINYFREAIEVMEKDPSHDASLLSSAYEGLGDVYELIGDYEKALSCFSKAASLNESRRATSEALRKIGRVHEKRGETDAAMESYEEAFASLGEDQASVEMARLCMNTGWLYGRKAQYDKAVDYCLRALKLLEGTDYLADIAQAHNNLAVLYEFKGDWEKAYQHNRMSIEIMEKIGDKRKLGAFYASIGLLSWKRGQLEEAEKHFQRNLSLMEQIGNKYGVAGAYLNLAQVKCDRNLLQESEELAQKCLNIHQELKAEGRLCSNYRLMGEIALKKGDLGQAETFLKEAEALAQRNNFKFDIAMIRHLQGRLETQKGNNPSPCFQESIEILSALKRTYELGTVLKSYGLYLTANQHPDEGNRCLQQAAAIFKELGITP